MHHMKGEERRKKSRSFITLLACVLCSCWWLRSRKNRFCNFYFPGDLLMQRGKHTSLFQPSSRTPSAISMTFFPEKSTFILQSAGQPLLQRLPLQSRPQSLITEPSLNLNPSPRLLKYLPQHSPHKHEPQPKPQQLVLLKVCPALGHLQIVPRWRR